MGGLFNILGTGLKYLFAAVGLLIWLGGAGVAVFYGLDAIGGGGFASLEKIGGYVSIAGLLIALVGSVILLRLTGKLVPFLLCIAFGGAAFLGGNSGMFPSDMKMGEADRPAATMSAPSVGAPSSPAPDAAAAPVTEEDVARASPAPPLPPGPSDAPGSLASRGPASVDQETVARGEIGSSESDDKLAAKDVLGTRSGTGAAPKADQFQVAELSFNKPSEMRLQHPYVVEATIAAPGAAAPSGLGNVGPTVTRQTEITRKVRVELIANDFKVEKLHTVDTVLITPKTQGQWSWRVTPLTEGADRKMLLQVFGVLEEGGVAQGEVLIKTYEETIPVTVTPMDRVSQVTNTVVSSWQTLAGIAGVIGGIWVFLGNIAKALRGKKEEPAAA